MTRWHQFDVPADEVLANLTIGLKEERALRDLRSDNPARREVGTIVLGELSLVPRALEVEPCKDADPETFFPYAGPENGRTQETADALLEQARRICSGCSVAAQCLEGAIERDERFGVWGGRDFLAHPATPRKNSRQRSAS